MKTKRFNSLIVMVGILLCWLVPTSICASVEVDGIYYELNSTDMTASVAYSSSYSGVINIPPSFIYNGDTYSVTSIGEEAFNYCSKLASITIPNSVTIYGESAFDNCTSLTSMTIPNGVTSIGKWAFEGCTGLNTVTIPNSVDFIGNGAFEGCTGLTSITCKCETPVPIEEFVFYYVPKSTCTLYVPVGAVPAYRNADFWNEFEHIEEYDDSSEDISIVEQEDGSVKLIFDIQGRQLKDGVRQQMIIENGHKVIRSNK